MQPRRRTPDFDPHRHRAALAPLVDAIARAGALDARALDRLTRSHPRPGGGLFSKSEIIAGYRAFGGGLAEREFAGRLRLRPVRTLSGVTPVTVLTRPYPCPGTCIFCPSDVRMPKSYLADEPGAQRAEDNGFDPYLQTWNRLAAYRAMGHPVEKVELIVLGGTWSAYPEAYRIGFVLRCLEALSDFGAGRDQRARAGGEPMAALPPVDGRGGDRYNDVVRRVPLPRASEAADFAALAAEQRRNEDAGVRCVGLSVETRPDHVSESEVLQLRRLGVTRLQLGIQSLSDAVLWANRRGHDVAASRRALFRLRSAGFKLHLHWMPNLLGATPETDAADFERLFADPDFRPDELKVYPCLLVASAELMRSFERGEWRPYDDRVLQDLLEHCLARTPRYCRLTRVVRDFSSHDIVAGTRVANLREVAERALTARGAVRAEIRAREIRGERFDRRALRLRTTAYATSVGEERFLELVTPEDRLVAFLRLSLPSAPSFVAELGRAALIRELHVYGESLPLREPGGERAQHRGLGRGLVEESLRQAGDAGYRRLAVISSVGTRGYYRALGFADGELYQSRPS